MQYTKPHKVLKFGGTSLGNPDTFKNAVSIIARSASEGRIVVVASALAEITDLLVDAADRDGASKTIGASLAADLEQRHLTHARTLLKTESFHVYARRLKDLLSTFESAGGRGQLSRHDVLAQGERLCVPLVALALRDAGVAAVPVDARTLIHVESSGETGVVRIPISVRRIRDWYDTVPEDVVPVVTGFLAGDGAGRTVTLGRGGSDYSASVLAAALEAGVLERWTDVDGVYTDDPRRNDQAQHIAEMSLATAYQKTLNGGIGMHQRALDPLLSAGIPVHIRSTWHPDLPGTWISPSLPAEGVEKNRVASA